MKLSPFDVAKNINNKDGLIDPDIVFTAFVPFVINRNFSGTIDTLCIANAANMMTSLPKEYANEMLYKYYYHSVEKNPHRYAKWIKQTKDDGDMEELIEALSKYYKCSIMKAVDLIDVHTPEQLNHILECNDKGGKL